jgi:hypothetical protein
MKSTYVWNLFLGTHTGAFGFGLKTGCDTRIDESRINPTTANQVPTTCLLNHHNSSSHHLIVPTNAIQVIPLDCPNTAHQVIPLDCTTLTSQSLTLWPSPHANYEGFDHALISASERLSWQVTMGPLHKPVLNKIQVREIRLQSAVIPQHTL